MGNICIAAKSDTNKQADKCKKTYKCHETTYHDKSTSIEQQSKDQSTSTDSNVITSLPVKFSEDEMFIWEDLDETQKWFRELPDNIGGYVNDFLATATSVMDDLKKTYDEEGFFAVTKKGAKGLFDNTTGLVLNLFKDGAAAIADHYEKGEVAEELAALDFSSDNFIQSIKDLLKILNFDKIAQAIQEMIDSAILKLPKILRPNTIAEQIEDKKIEIAEEKADIEKGTFGTVGFSDKDNREKLAKLEQELADLEAELPEVKGETIESISNKESLVYKTKELKSISQIRTETGAPPVVSIMQGGNDNKQIKYEGDTIMKPYRVGPVEMTSEAVLKFKSE